MFLRLLLERCARAFVAGATASFAAGMASTDFSVTSLRAVAIGAGAAGVSAVMSIVSQWFGNDPASTSFLSTPSEK
jgi:malic enzyme